MWRRYVKRFGWGLTCAAALLGLPHIARADDDPRIDMLLKRIERLEKQNQELVESIKAPPAGRSVALPDGPPQATSTGPVGADSVGADSVRELVSEYLRQAEEKKAATIPEGKTEDGGFVVGRNLGMTSYWKNGLWTESADKAFRVHVGGRTQVDYVGYTADSAVQFGKGGVGQIQDGVNYRRARLEVDGTCFEVVDFFAEYEFLGNTFNVNPGTPGTPTNIANTPGPTDLWATVTHIPWLGNVRVGNMKPPISLEHLTSSRWLDFMERSFAFDTYIGGTNNGFIPGIQFFSWTEDERITWHLGVFKNNQTVLGWNVGDGELDVTGRLTWLPWYKDDGRYLMHLGLGMSHRDLNDDVARLRARTLLRNGPFTLQTVLADTTVGGDGQTLIVPEFALILGPLMFQAEYYGSWINNTTLPAGTGPNIGTTFSQSAYVETTYFLTGEHRPWNKKGDRASGSAPDRVIPFRNYHFVPGHNGHLFSSGAWQAAARFSWIDLDNKAMQAGTLYDVTLGLNWFLNPNMKFQWNYDWAYRNAAGNTSDGTLQGFGMRLALDF